LRWVTRERAKVDRIACSWLIRKFIDKDAQFIFAPNGKVTEIARSEGAIPFDVPGVELSHYSENGTERVTFDALIKKYDLKDPALLELAKIVRGADARVTGLSDSAPESAGLEAAATGFRLISRDDKDNMNIQLPLYEALYRFCQLRVSEGNELKNTLQ
jgi:hypothetical protein